MKRRTIILLFMLLSLLVLAACGGDSSASSAPAESAPPAAASSAEPEPAASEPDPEPTKEPKRVPADEKEVIQFALEDIVSENYSSTDIDRISINENLGTEEAGDYVALAYLKWNVKNSAKTTKEMLAMYSSDFAARTGMDVSNVSEFAVFWTVPYFSETDTVIKYSYERKGEGMYQTDCMVSNLLS